MLWRVLNLTLFSAALVFGNDDCHGNSSCPEIPPANCNYSYEQECSYGVDQNGCDMGFFCIDNWTTGNNGTECYNHCPVMCGVNETWCSYGYDWTTGCDYGSFCLPAFESGYDGEDCPVQCPCPEQTCAEHRDDRGCVTDRVCIPWNEQCCDEEPNYNVNCTETETCCHNGFDEKNCDMGLFCYPNLAPEGCPPDQCPCFNDEKWCPDPWAEPMYNVNGTQCPDPFICVPYNESCPEKPDNATDNNSTWTCYDPYYPPEGCNNDQFMCYMGNDSNGCDMGGYCLDNTYNPTWLPGFEDSVCDSICHGCCEMGSITCWNGYDELGCDLGYECMPFNSTENTINGRKKNWDSCDPCPTPSGMKRCKDPWGNGYVEEDDCYWPYYVMKDEKCPKKKDIPNYYLDKRSSLKLSKNPSIYNVDDGKLKFSN